uniref:Uncharacterized protein n=1 Tax=Rhizophora mucronata TaxID=61149 RepID=A0A2P2QSV3_RHIMU
MFAYIDNKRKKKFHPHFVTNYSSAIDFCDLNFKFFDMDGAFFLERGNKIATSKRKQCILRENPLE